MKPILLISLLSILPMAIAHSAVPPTAMVTLLDGRQLEGQLDDATDANHLWLRRGTENMQLAISYRWEEVASIEIDGILASSEKLLANPDEYVAAWPEFFLFAQHEPIRRQPAKNLAPSVRQPRAASSHFVATLANWDRDVEPDGYEVAVTVLDELGHPMSIRGTLSAQLIGEHTDVRGVPDETVSLERWSERLRPDQFVGGPAVIRLPFRKVNPETRREIAPDGILQVEVGAFGHGRFASSAAVPVRVFNPFRDRLEQRTGSRFFPGEKHQRWSHE